MKRERKTKIVATVGAPRGGIKNGKQDLIVNPDGDPVVKQISHGELLTWFIEAGVDVIRFNMYFAGLSEVYGSNEAKYLDWLDENKYGIAKYVAVLGDLPGPKLRLGEVQTGKKSKLERGEKFRLYFGSQEIPADENHRARVQVSGLPFSDQIKKIDNSKDIGSFIKAQQRAKEDVIFSIGDGKVRMKAVSEHHGIVECIVTEGGKLTNGKGLTIKGASLAVSPFQEQDKKALDFLLDKGGDLLAYVAVSFVQSRDDILIVKKYIADKLEGKKEHQVPGVIAKIETRDAWNNLDAILDVADGVMVARGDLGEQLPPEEIPNIQKQIIKKCNIRGKPVITATQMLDSMEENLEPKRAETTDVFNAIIDRSDAVMLSGETSTGRYPVQAIEMMGKIAEQAETYFFSYRRSFQEVLKKAEDELQEATDRFEKEAGDLVRRAEDGRYSEDRRKTFAWQRDFFARKQVRSKKQPITDRISAATCSLSEDGGYNAIIAPTTSGRTVFMISRFRPNVLLIGAAHQEIVYRKLILSFGVHPLFIGMGQKTVSEVLNAAMQTALDEGLLTLMNGDDEREVVVTAGTPLFQPGTTNLIQILKVKSQLKDRFPVEDPYSLLADLSFGLHDKDSKIQRHISAAFYLSNAETRQLIEIEGALLSLLDVFGFEMEKRYTPIRGSIFEKFIAKTTEATSHPEVLKILKKIEYALEKEYIDKTQATINEVEANAVKALIESVANIPNAVFLIGSLLILKFTNKEKREVILSMSLNSQQTKLLQNNPELLSQPYRILDEIGRLNDG